MSHFRYGLLCSRQISAVIVLQHHLVLQGAEGISQQLLGLLRGKKEKGDGGGKENKSLVSHAHCFGALIVICKVFFNVYLKKKKTNRH